jgi:AcrR family transcriptional regulator
MDKPKRSDSRKARTRRALVDAARNLVLERGSNQVLIAEITSAGAVGLGTFYSYFDTKEAIFVAVVDEMTCVFRDALDERRQRLKDPAMVVAETVRFSLIQAIENPDFYRFVACAGLTDRVLTEASDQCLADLERGRDAGRFKLDRPEYTCSLLLRMVRHVPAGLLDGSLDSAAIEETIRLILRMLGLPDVARASRSDRWPRRGMRSCRKCPRLPGVEATRRGDRQADRSTHFPKLIHIYPNRPASTH